MASDVKKAETIDEYIEGFSEEIQEILQRIRVTIGRAAPEAKETINYQIPTLKLNGNLVHFAAFKKHIGFYPAPTGIAKFKDLLTGYETAKGSVKFPLDEPIPYNLIAQITKFRAEEQQKK